MAKGISSLTIATVSFGTSAIFIRYATEVSALSLTFYRLSIAALAMLLFAYSTGRLRTLTGTKFLLVIVSSLALSLHFTAFILAVKFTTVANATFLVSTSPMMLAVLSPILIGERTTSREGVGVTIATLGILFVANAGNSFHSFGLADFSALLAAFFISFYSMIGRFLRARGMNTACYTAYVYSIAAVIALLLVEILRSDATRTYDATNMLAILGLALIPTLLGHSLYNYSLGSVKTV